MATFTVWEVLPLKTRKDYTFDTTISPEVLKNYLSRSVTAGDLYKSETLMDDIRVLLDLGVKFIGRASGVWFMTMDDEEHFAMSKALCEKIHKKDAEIILQACVFEAVFNELNAVKIPAYVFEAFGLPEEERCFCIDDMLFPEAPKGFIWKDEGGIPDLNRNEARMWFYYRATRYIDCGYEALHMGQIHLYTANDTGMQKTYQLFDMIRRYAEKNARRHKILLDAHTHGVSVNGRLLFDYHAMPFTRFPLLDREDDALVLVREGFSEGGTNPNGWSADVMPYLMEYDNWGGKMADDFSEFTKNERAFMDWWGYDQIGWFANQSEENRNRFLEYTYKWTAVNNTNAYFEVPFRRMLSSAAVVKRRADNGAVDRAVFYQLNDASASCPLGFSQEKTVKQLWSDGDDELRQKAGNPMHLLQYGAHETFDPATGYKLPEKIVVYGSFQSQVGAVDHDSNSEITRMYYVGDNTYTLSVVLPYPGTYSYAVSTYGTLSATYCSDRFPRSGSSNKASFTTEKENTVVKFTFIFMENSTTVEII